MKLSLKAASLTPFLALTTFLFIIFTSLEANAGCGSKKAKAYSINLSTQTKSPVDHGEVTECQSMQGSFESFVGERMDFGWANCLVNCEKGFKPTEIYVRVGETFKPGSHKRDGWEKTCVQQFGSATMYCHEAI